jgi:cellulose synthase/poly-beta-1,6-N-acetylglucosamine synthase-like glycosyltransferase/glycosyltransferase involved in cell wall biosynthesis/O-antigen/teichoic acid export membrane protein
MAELDIVIPAHNEEGNIAELGERLIKILRNSEIDYSLIFVDDNSNDNTVGEVAKLAEKYCSSEVIYSKNPSSRLSEKTEIEILINSPKIKLVKKIGPNGKATAVLQGARAGDAPFVAMIDADLQYPPEAIPALFEKAKVSGIAVAERIIKETSFIRNVGTKINKLVFEKLLLGLNCDAQSGLKVFKRDILGNLDTNQVASWTLDMPLLLTALDMGYSIEKEKIEFTQRKAGKSKVNFLKTGYEIAKSVFKLKFRKHKVLPIEPNRNGSIIGTGVSYRGKKYITHTRLSPNITAINTFIPWQELSAAVVVAIIILGLVINAKLTGIALVSVLSITYFVDLLFSAFIINKSLNSNPEIKINKKEINSLKNKDLPVYSILCPLYKEANVLPQFVENIENLDWPKDKLDVLLLLEEDDAKTISVAKKLNLPKHFRILVVPNSFPKTKPKACNYGLAYVKGKFTVIYDAEDRPDPLQLKKAYIAFGKINSKVVCLQCKLNYYNPRQNILTKLFTAEYSLWFDLILPGLQGISTTIPLGGTSNHFRTSALKYLDGWDPFNVTEDADLGTRLFKKSFQTAIIDSTTYEEANSKLKSWIKQRSRWIKGYLQTYLVHMRDPIGFYKKYGKHAFIFQLVTGLRMVFTLVNPVLWLVTLSYFTLRPLVGEAIEALYPQTIYYIALTTLVFGNFFYFYIYMIALAKTKRWELIKYVFLIPYYWLLASIAAVVAFYQLITKPFYWEKTTHGLNLPGASVEEEKIEVQIPEINPKPSIAAAFETRQKLNWFFIPAKFKKSLTPEIVGSGILILATVVAHFTNFVFSAYLGRFTQLEDFGTISLINNIFSLTTIITGALTLTVGYKAARLLGKYNIASIIFWKKIRKYAWGLSIISTLVWLLLIPYLKGFFQTESTLPYQLFTPFWIVAFVGSVDIGFLSGTLNFVTLAALTATAPLLKLLVAYTSVNLGYVNGVFLAIPFSTVITFGVGWWAISKTKNASNQKLRSTSFEFPKNFFAASVLSKLATTIFLSADIILAKHYLPPVQAGQYALLSLSGKIVYFLGDMFSQLVNPFVSRNEGAKRDSSTSFNVIFIATLLAGFAGFTLIGIFGRTTIPLLLGTNTEAILGLLPIYSIGVLCFTLAATTIGYHQAKGHYTFPILGFFIALVEVSYISLFHTDINEIAETVSVTGFFFLIYTTVLHYAYPLFDSIINGFSRIRIFPPIAQPSSANGLRILIFNWRDKKHVWSGGAEVYIHEIAKRLVKGGNQVTLFCGNDGKNPDNETVDGIRIVRRGGFYMVYFWAIVYYLAKFRDKFDVVIDSENGIPFFSPLFVKEPVICLVHHVHKDIILNTLKLPFYLKPVAFIAKQLESLLMPAVYSGTQMVTVSESSKNDMEELGFGKIKPIQVINPGVDLTSFFPGEKTTNPSILYLGRIKAYKSIGTVIQAMSKVVEINPSATLKIAGFGEERINLEKLTKKLKLQKSVQFLGKVNDIEKTNLMRSSWLFVYPSTKEGFGISSIEASASGTPVIASNVSGLKDSVKNRESGLLVAQDNIDEWANKINLLINDRKLRETLEKNSLLWAQNFTWERSREKLTYVIRNEIARTKELPNLLGKPAISGVSQ